MEVGARGERYREGFSLHTRLVVGDECGKGEGEGQGEGEGEGEGEGHRAECF